MALSDLTLKKGQVILTQTDGSVATLDNSPFIYGSIVSIANLSDMYVVGDVVLFDPMGSTKFSISGSNFFITTEDKLYWEEPLV